ncbi:MAG TPA: hypothetical protein VL967_03005 [Terracidiphilus sp.]|nr:hypothetical protein [Terracidiphilus sp.]
MRLAALLLALAPLAWGQQPPDSDRLVDRLYAYAQQYRDSLPSFACDETILSRQTRYRGKAGRGIRVEGTMREIRKVPPDPYDPFTEQHQFTKLNGKPAKGAIRLPYFIQGGFANLIGFHHSELRDCFSFRITPLSQANTFQLQIDRKETPETAASCRGIFAGTQYRVIADAEGHILHSERTIPAETAEQEDEAYFAAIDYAPQQFGERSFWLPTKFASHDPAGAGSMEAVYSNCHRYTGDMTILSGSEPEASPSLP